MTPIVVDAFTRAKLAMASRVSSLTMLPVRSRTVRAPEDDADLQDLAGCFGDPTAIRQTIWARPMPATRLTNL